MTTVQPQSSPETSSSSSSSNLMNRFTKGTKNLIAGLMATVQSLVPSATTTGVLGTAAAATTLESCQLFQKGNDPTPIDEEPPSKNGYETYTPYTAENKDIGSFTGFFDTNKLLIPTDDVKLTLNFAKGSSIEQKLLPVINERFKSITELHGSPFTSLEDFLGFMVKNKDKFPIGFTVAAMTPNGNYGYGGLNSFFDDITKVQGTNIPMLSILKSINEKAVEKDKFLTQTINNKGESAVMMLKPCVVNFDVFIDNANGLDSKLFFTVKFVHNGEVWVTTPLNDVTTLKFK